MVSSEEIIERSLYMALLSTALKAGVTLDPENYLVNGACDPVLEKKFLSDKGKIDKFVYIFGVGNNQSRGIKDLPRICLNLKCYYPGSIGFNKFNVEKGGDSASKIELNDFMDKDVQVDVVLSAGNQPDMRLLHSIMYAALPGKGYIKPYLNDREAYFNSKVSPTNNLFIEVGNYYDHSDVDHGILEKTYTYVISDGLVSSYLNSIEDIPLIRDISAVLNSLNSEESDKVTMNIP